MGLLNVQDSVVRSDNVIELGKGSKKIRKKVLEFSIKGGRVLQKFHTFPELFFLILSML